jgi:hypothetical protein
MIFAVSVPAHAQQRPSQKPVPPAAVPLQPPTPSAGELRNHNQSPTRGNQQPAAKDKRGTDEIPLSVKILPSADHESQAKEEQRRANEHAAAERGLVNATWYLAWFTLGLAMVASGQVALFVWQLKLIRKSAGDTETAAIAARDTAIALQSSLNIARDHADATSEAAKAAGDSARIAERALTDVERALILAVRFDVNQMVRANRAFGYRVTVIFVNSGRTPALRLRGNFNLVVFPSEPMPDFAYPDRAAPEDAFGTTGPQVPVLFHLEIVTEDLVDVREGRKIALIYGWVEYDDVFSSTRRRRTEACLRIEVVGDIHRIRPADEPIGATPSVLAFANYRGRYNAIDEYCLYEPGQTPVDDGSLPALRQPPPISEDAV